MATYLEFPADFCGTLRSESVRFGQSTPKSAGISLAEQMLGSGVWGSPGPVQPLRGGVYVSQPD
jgi:hypothetical protein